MLIQRIAVANFMARGTAELELPEVGVTVLTGHNGAGKSRFVEAVAYAYWGETLRGADPWIDALDGSVSVLSDQGDATRKITAKGTKSLLWNGSKADTPTRTQELIRQRVCEFDFWRRTHVFSSGEAAHFSLASDGERKRVMEALLGMEVFDRGQRAALDALGAANAALAAAKLDLSRVDGELAVAVAKRDAVGDDPPFVPGTPPAAPNRDLDELDQQRATVEFDVSSLEVLRSQAAQASRAPFVDEHAETVRQAKLQLGQLEQRLALARAGQCDHCGQAWHGASADELEQQSGDAAWTLSGWEQAQADARAAHDERTGQAALRWRELDQQLTALGVALRDLAATRASVVAKQAAVERWEAEETKRRADWQAQCAARQALRVRAQALVATLTDERDELQAAVDDAERRVEELKVVGQILGVRGLRGHVLGRALEGVEAVANYWLGRIAPGRALTVRAEGDAGKIVIGLHGYGGGKYKAASAGERRRVDAPLLLALAEVAGAGRSRGTLFLDEVFDALDGDGRALVCQALGEIGQTQPVVVITHQEDLARNIPAVQRYEVVQGALRPL